MKAKQVAAVWKKLDRMGVGKMRDANDGTLDAVGALLVDAGCPPEQISAHKVNPRFIYLVMEKHGIELHQLVRIVNVNDLLSHQSGVARRDFMVDWLVRNFPDSSEPLPS